VIHRTAAGTWTSISQVTGNVLGTGLTELEASVLSSVDYDKRTDGNGIDFMRRVVEDGSITIDNVPIKLEAFEAAVAKACERLSFTYPPRAPRAAEPEITIMPTGDPTMDAQLAEIFRRR